MRKWKRVSVAVLFASFALSVFCIGSMAEDKKDNLLVNPGFENERNGMHAWQPNKHSNAMNASLIEGDIKTGKRSLFLEDAKANGCVGSIRNMAKIRVNTGDKLLVKFWCKGSGRISAGFVEYKKENGKLLSKTKGLPHCSLDK
ncbi:MAG: hypothetical protein P9M03_00295, partial [Candidatus Theseobacter exili]|nr:hypothetical protein [Candidatus Theseobacter exili]